MFGPNLNDEILKAYIDKVFDKYDVDKSGALDAQQLTVFFNDLFQTLNIPTSVNQQQSLEAIKSMDQNFDGSIDRKQLFDAFKLLVNKANQQQHFNSFNNQNMYMQQNPAMFHTPGYGYQNTPNYPNGMVPNPYLQGHSPMQNQYYQPQMQQSYTPPHHWNDPMMSQVKNPYINNNSYSNNNDQNMPNVYNNTSSMKASFGGGWSKRAK